MIPFASSRWAALLLVLAPALPALPALPAQEPAADHVILVTVDGLRWQELFGGIQNELIGREQGVKDLPGLRRRFVRPDQTDRCRALMPFFWEVIVKQGQVFGAPGKNADCALENGHVFSYPGYTEMLCGVVDERIDSNAKRPNPNLSVLTFLSKRPGFENRVRAVCTWDVFPYILREDKGVPVLTAWEPLQGEGEEEQRINRWAAALPHYWPDVSFDAVAIEEALLILRRDRPRVLYVSLGETDSWAHARRYDLYLGAARAADDFLRRLWTEVEKTPGMAGRTALVLTTDHGRGGAVEDWTDHGAKVPGAEKIWIAVLGAGVPALGLRTGVATTQGQVAATVAALVGEDFRSSVPAAKPPLPLRK